MKHEQVVHGLLELGVRGSVVVVHVDLHRLNLTEADAEWMAAAIVDAVGPTGTVLMPTFTYDKTVVTGPWEELPADPFRTTIPFHLDLPTVDPVAEAFRHRPGALRTDHPTHSFAALGPRARELLSTHRDNNPLGPLKKLNLLRGSIVLLGAQLDRVTALQLALQEAGRAPRRKAVALRINAAGYQERVVIDPFPSCTQGFAKLEGALDPALMREVRIGGARLRAGRLRDLLQFASTALADSPTGFVCDLEDCPACGSK